MQDFNIIYNHGPNYSKADYKKNVKDGVTFIKTFIIEYCKVIDQEVHRKFIGEFMLRKQDSISAKLVISSFGESLIYLFPDSQNQVFIDCIDFPVQTALAYGFINLCDPKTKVNLSKVHLKMPLPNAIKEYNSEPGRITITEGNGGAIFSSGGTLVFENVHKIFSFQRQTILGLMSNLVFKNSSPLYVQVYGHAGSQEINTSQGLLMLSSENTFNWSFKIATKLGIETAEIELKKLITDSEFFRLFIADNKLIPKAEGIIRKQERAIKDKSYQYPLWEFKKDVSELRDEAKHIGIDSSYVDELLKEPSLKPTHGILFAYYPNARGFMFQWVLMNFVFFSILVVLTLIQKYGNIQLLSLAMRAFSAFGINFSIIALMTIANGWVFSKKPESITVAYWIFPCIIYFICIAYCILVVYPMSYVPAIGKG